MKTILTLALAGAAFLAGFGYGRWYGPRAAPASAERKVLYWVDPMHPAYKSDKPGIAPDCGMKLEPVYEGGAAKPEAAARKKVLYYRDPQDPSYRSDKKGLNPETGNDLEPVYDGALTFDVSPEKQHLIGVRFGVVEETPGASSFRAAAKVAQDETRVTRVHSKTEGWIERVHADFTGQFIEKGAAMLTLYSPELLATQQEFLLAIQSKTILTRSTLPEAAGDSDRLIEAARRRLELWDLSDAQIDEVRRSGKPIRSITVHSPAAGYVVARNAFPSQRITPETELYQIVDLSRVWIVADVFENDMPSIRIGQAATISLPSENGRSFGARVSYLQPQIDPSTRTLKVRLEAANAGMRLKPEMFVDVEFHVPEARRITVPVDAVLDTGSRRTVFVDRGNGALEPRQVETGERTADRVEIRRGLAPGERIVTSGTFLLDSESQLKPPAEQSK